MIQKGENLRILVENHSVTDVGEMGCICKHSSNIPNFRFMQSAFGKKCILKRKGYSARRVHTCIFGLHLQRAKMVLEYFRGRVGGGGEIAKFINSTVLQNGIIHLKSDKPKIIYYF